MVTPSNDLPKPNFSGIEKSGTEKSKPRGPPSPSKHPRTTSTPNSIARGSLTTSGEEGRPLGKMPKVALFPKLPIELQTDIGKQAKLFKSSAKLQELAKQSPLIPLAGDNENDVYITKGLGDGEVVFKPGNVAMLNKMCDGIARMLGLGSYIPSTKAGKADVISRRDLQEDSKLNAPHMSDYQKLSNHHGEEVLFNLDSDVYEIAENVVIHGDTVYCIIEDEEVCLIPAEDGKGLEVKDPSSIKTPIEIAAEKSNKFKILGKEDDDEAVFLAPKESLGKLSENKAIGKVALINNYIYKVVPDKDTENCHLNELNIPQNKGKTPDQTLFAKEFSIMELEDEEGDVEDVIVPTDVMVELEEKPSKGKRSSSFEFMGKEFEVKEIQGKAGTFEIKAKAGEETEELPFKNEIVTLVNDSKGNYYVLPKEDESVIEKDDSTSREYVERNGQKYEVIHENGSYHVIGHDIRGMVQSKIENTFTKPAVESRENDTRPPPPVRDIDIRSPTPARELFYQRIDMKSFEEAFLLTILLRPQDGKVIDLGQSNVLFQAITEEGKTVDPQNPDVKLRPVLIDLDETMPKSNGYSLDPDFVNDEHLKVHCVRCGLMAFPQARKKLSKEEKKILVDFAKRLQRKEESIIAYLKTFEPRSSTFKFENVNAFRDIVDRTVTFILKENKASWTLEDLFFDVFPEYKKQWERLGDEAPEIKASRIGVEDEKDLIPLSEKIKRNAET